MATRNTHAGGAFIAFGGIAGTGGGAAFGQPTIGLLVGLAAGTVAATFIWWRERTIR